MADTDAPKAPETGADDKALENNVSVPPQGAPEQSNAELEAARKEAEQARMRANQLENQLAEAKRREAEAEQAKLQEKEDYKTLWEQTQSELLAIREKEEQSAVQAEITKKESEVTSQYSEEVLEIAKTAGLKLSGVDETAAADFKAKLDKISEKVGATAKPRPENHQAPNAETLSKEQAIERLKQGDRTAVTDAVNSLGFVQAYNKAYEQE